MSDVVDKEIQRIESTREIYSDIYNARIFVELWKNKIRWCKDYGGWFIFNGRYWERDSNDKIKEYAMRTHAHMIGLIEKIKDKKYFTHLKNSAADNKLNAMLSCSKPLLGALSEEFDRDEYLFNCTNGTLDLRTGELYEFKPDDLITKTSTVKYDKDAPCPLWEKFMSDIFLHNKELVDFMQTAIGYSLTAMTVEQCLFILYGSGRNGKSKFLQTIVNLLGDYSMNCPSSTFIRKQNVGIPNDVARLKGARFVTAIESNQNVSFDESMIKHITGEDRISARFLNKEFFDFTPTFKIFFATNHRPNIRGTDPGIWRRIKMVPFDLKITDEMEDKFIGAKLRGEQNGILNWAVAGCQRWIKDGLFTPPSVKKATAAYQDEEDIIGQFIKDHCFPEKDSYIPVKIFKDRVIEYCGFKMSQKQLSGYMESHGFKDIDNRKKVDGMDVRVYKDLKFIVPHERKQDMGWQE